MQCRKILHTRWKSCLILTNKMLRFKILFYSCRNGCKRSNRSAARQISAVLWAGKPQFPSVRRRPVATTRRVHKPGVQMREGQKNARSRTEQRNAEKWFSLFRRSAQLPFRLRPSEIARWLDYLDISSWVILPHLSISFCLSPSHSSFRWSLSSFSTNPARGQLAVNWMPIISRVAGVSFCFSLWWTSPPCICSSHLRFISISHIRSHALPRFPLLPHQFSLPSIAVGLTVCFT